MSDTGNVRLMSLPMILVAMVAVGFALWAGQVVFMPVAFALFVIGLTAPLMQTLKPAVGRAAAIILAVIVAIAVFTLFLMIVGWSAGRLAQWAFANLGRLQSVYVAADQWLAQFDVGLAYLLPDQFNPAWVINPVLGAFNQFRSVANFLLLVFVFVILGLAELDGTARTLQRLEAEHGWLKISALAAEASAGFGQYMRVRFLISVVDGTLCYLFFRLVGLDEPLAWAALIFTLNFIPFIGPLIAALLIGFFSAAQFADFWMVLLLVGGTTFINFGLGSFVEPLVQGARLRMSAFLVLLSVFLWYLIWDIPGAFLGVQISIVTLIALRLRPETQWLADLLSGGDPPPGPTRPT